MLVKGSQVSIYETSVTIPSNVEAFNFKNAIDVLVVYIEWRHLVKKSCL